jgi:hypothetical protein
VLNEFVERQMIIFKIILDLAPNPDPAPQREQEKGEKLFLTDPRVRKRYWSLLQIQRGLVSV